MKRSGMGVGRVGEGKSTPYQTKTDNIRIAQSRPFKSDNLAKRLKWEHQENVDLY